VKFVSLFAGIGGFDVAFERAGHECVGQCEIDPHAHAVLERHWPHVPQHDDVTTITANTFEHPDVVTFGSPCQDLSVAGKRAGMSDGTRSGLFFEAVRYIREVLEATNGSLPRLAVWENVPGAYSSNGGADFATVLALLVGGEVRCPTHGWSNAGVAFGPLGSAEWRTLDSQHFGVAQRRRRVFLVYRPGGERAGAVLLEPDSMQRDSEARGEAREDVAGPLEARTTAGGFPGTDGAVSGHVVPVTADTLTVGANQTYGFNGEAVPVLNDQGGGVMNVAEAITTSADRTRAAPVIAFDLAQITSATNRTRAGPGRPMSTLAANSDPHVAMNYAVRRLTPRESERLQGLPDDHTRYRVDGTEIADTHRYRMLGNAVTVNVAEWIGRRLS
jgi:DNA (cytosine-5)-methyltransferase 1